MVERSLVSLKDCLVSAACRFHTRCQGLTVMSTLWPQPNVKWGHFHKDNSKRYPLGASSTRQALAVNLTHIISCKLPDTMQEV